MWNWFSPKGIVFGEGKAASTGLFARQWGRGRALVITGPFLRRSGVVEPVLQSLREEGLLGAVFSDIPSEPTDRHIREALGLFRRERCGTIVACGGGGPIDVAKAVSLLDANGGAVRDYAGVGRVPHPGVPIIAIPTTAGSGSEVSGTTIITEEAAHEKLLVISMYLVPEIAILDPLLTYGMPPALTAATGVDALTHAIESCVSRKATKLTIDFSLRAAGRLARFLPVAFASPDDAEARRECLLGSLEAGIAFTNSSVALVHGIVSRLVRELHIPRLRDLLSREALDAQLDAMVREAVASGSPANNPRPASPEEIASLYGEAF
ncbi:iron-containing alcohol dehydrogenase [Bilophila wadsworthia]|uniref:iron-containing alcohol dehydrogenase n=1 Tax=Bilophila wadsworthia TaxID=35833 RepID=UPI0034CD1AC4